MSEITTAVTKKQTNLSSPSSLSAASADGSRLLNADSFHSHVLATDKQTISLAVPGQAILTLDISGNRQLEQLQSGQALRVSVTMTGQDRLKVTIDKVVAVSEPIAQIPLSRELADKLAANTKFPQNLAQQNSYIKSNEPVAIGQARRLPNEIIKLVTPDKKTISAPLPSSIKVPLNQTYTLALIIAKDGTPQVQFTKLAPPPSPIVVSTTVAQLASNSPQTDLAKLLTTGMLPSLSQPQNLRGASVGSASVQGVGLTAPSATAGSQQLATIDMSLPKNQLWLRYQPLSQLMTQLAQVTTEIAQLSPKSSVQVLPQYQTMPGSNTPSQTNGQTGPAKSTVASTHSTTAMAAQQQSPSPQQPGLAPAKVVREPQTLPPKHQLTAAAAPTVGTSIAKMSLTPAANREQTQANPLTQSQSPQADTKAKTPQPLPGFEPNVPAKGSAKTSSAASIPPATLNSVLDDKQSPTGNNTNLKPQSNGESLSPKESQISHYSLQKLASLLTSLKTKASQNIATSQLIATPRPEAPSVQEPRVVDAKLLDAKLLDNKVLNNKALDKKTLDINGLKTNSTTIKHSELKGTQPSFDAISRLQSLTKQLQHSLPNMRQLTTAPMLPSLIEQVVRFNPLNPASISLSSLGPLAGALQLLLAGHSGLNSSSQPAKPLSPELVAQLKKILQQGKAANKANLVHSLTQLGNFGSLKSLEQTLASLSGHLQLYQYQSQEHSSNNQQIFYFTLPTSESLLPQIEGQIEQKSHSDEPQRKTWQLTLLLPVGATDKIKASANLQGTSVEIELLSNNAEIVKKAKPLTAFLSQRLISLGLTTPEISCKQAELPKSLLKRPHQLVELMI